MRSKLTKSGILLTYLSVKVIKLEKTTVFTVLSKVTFLQEYIENLIVVIDIKCENVIEQLTCLLRYIQGKKNVPINVKKTI